MFLSDNNVNTLCWRQIFFFMIWLTVDDEHGGYQWDECYGESSIFPTIGCSLSWTVEIPREHMSTVVIP